MKRFLLLVSLALVCVIGVEARVRVAGFATQGGSIVTSGLTSTTKALKAYPLSTITVYSAGTTTPISIYADNSGTVKANPFTAGSDASWFFYCDNQRVDVRVSGTGITPFTISDIPAYDETIDYSSLTNLGQIKLDTTPASSANPIAVGSNSLAVKNVYQGYSIASYGATANDGTDDTTAIQNAAVAAEAAGQALFIPAGVFLVSDYITLTSGIQIVGKRGRDGTNLSQIKITATNKGVFLIGEGVLDVRIENVELKASSLTGTKLVKATGAYPNSSQRFSFFNVLFTNADRGISVEATDISKAWQFDYVEMENCTMVGVNTGIYLDARGTDWNIKNSQIYAFEDGFGIDCQTCGTMALTQVYGLGPAGSGAICPVPPTPNGAYSDTFLRIAGAHSNITIINSSVEGFRKWITQSYSDMSFPLVFINNAAGPLIELTGDTTFVSIGNAYYVDNVSAGGNSRTSQNLDAYTAADKCGIASAAQGRIIYSGNAGPVINSHRHGTEFGFRASVGGVIIDSSDPALAATSVFDVGSSINDKILMRLGQTSSGVFTNHYKISRDSSSGFLKFTGTQAIPNRGFDFNGPLKIAGTSSVSVSDAGNMVLNYNATSNLPQASMNGAAFANIITASTTLTANRSARIMANGVIANGLWLDDGSNMQLTAGLFRFQGATSSFPALKRNAANLEARLADDSGYTSFYALNGVFSGALSVTGASTTAALTASAAIKSSAGVSSFAKGADVPSAASIVPTGNSFHVTGVTNITSIDATGLQAGTRITIIFDGVLTVVDGSNLVLAGNFVTTTSDVLVLMFDGTNWYECSRSVN